MIEILRKQLGRVTEDKEEQILFPGVDPFSTESFHRHLVVEGFLEGNPGRVFTVNEMIVELPFPVGAETCHDILKKCDYAQRLTLKNKTAKYLSIAPSLEPTHNGVDTYDELGKQAQEDFYQLVNERAQCIKKKYKVVKKF